jgi:hypothetical protein
MARATSSAFVIQKLESLRDETSSIMSFGTRFPPKFSSVVRTPGTQHVQVQFTPPVTIGYPISSYMLSVRPEYPVPFRTESSPIICPLT